MAEKTIEEVLKEYTPELVSLRGVVGTAQGLCDAKPCIKVLVSEKTPELNQKIPELLEGYPVMREEMGKIRALPRTGTEGALVNLCLAELSHALFCPLETEKRNEQDTIPP